MVINFKDFGMESLKRLKEKLGDEKNEMFKDKVFSVGIRKENKIDMYTILDCFGTREINLFGVHEGNLSTPNKVISRSIKKMYIRIRGINSKEKNFPQNIKLDGEIEHL